MKIDKNSLLLDRKVFNLQFCLQRSIKNKLKAFGLVYPDFATCFHPGFKMARTGEKPFFLN
jgi:hypothetical protein